MWFLPYLWFLGELVVFCRLCGFLPSLWFLSALWFFAVFVVFGRACGSPFHGRDKWKTANGFDDRV